MSSSTPGWIDLGDAEALAKTFNEQFAPSQVKEVAIGALKIALTCRDGVFGAISGVCNHASGPLGRGTLDGDYIVCPWHYYKFHRTTGDGEPGFEADQVPRHDTKIEAGRLLVSAEPTRGRHKLAHPPHPLERELKRAPGPLRVVGISTTAMNEEHPRYSTSEALLKYGLETIAKERGVETKLIRLSELKVKNCEGYYSKAAPACTWPCSITQMDETDQMDQVYEALVHWADIVCVATPIRWGSASSLYFKMIERLNCVQNQITLNCKVLIQRKVAAFIITGGQDNVQSVAGGMLGFFSEIGFAFPPFPYVAHSLGWTAENMERNVAYVAHSTELRDATAALLHRAADTAEALLAAPLVDQKHFERGGRKARRLEPEAAHTADESLSGS